MFDPTDKSIQKLIEKYKALFHLAMKEHGNTSLSTDELKAVGKRVLDESIETAFQYQNIPKEDRPEIMKQFEELIRKECPDMTFDTPLSFDEKGFSKKH
jgi:hypothetical protein